MDEDVKFKKKWDVRGRGRGGRRRPEEAWSPALFFLVLWPFILPQMLQIGASNNTLSRDISYLVPFFAKNIFQFFKRDLFSKIDRMKIVTDKQQ